MNLVVDTNIFISALIKNSVTREIIVNSDVNFVLPEFELSEIKNHKNEIVRKAGIAEKDFDILLLRILNHVKIFPKDIAIRYKGEAKKIIEHIDSDDVQFIATALALNCPIWSDDKHFKKQNKIKILTTKEIINVLR